MYLISAYFDAQSNKVLNRYIKQIAEKTGNRFMISHQVPPHMTISQIEARSEAVLIAHFQKLQTELCKGSVEIASIGMMMPYVIYAMPVFNHFLFYHIFVPCTSKILQAVLKYDNCPPRPIKNDKKRRSKPFCTVFWLKCPPGACIFFAQRLHYNYRALLTFIKGGSSVANAMQRIGFFAGVLYHHTLFTSTPQRSVS